MALLVAVFICIRLGGGSGLGPYQFKVVLSESMQKTYPVGSMLVTEKVPLSEIGKGDVISFSVAGTTLSHRIIEIDHDQEDTTFRTKGDSNKDRDPFVVKSSQVLGKVRFGIPKLGLILLKLQTPRGFLAFCMFIADIYLFQLFLKILWS